MGAPASPALLEKARKRVKTLPNGIRVVEAGTWRTFRAWAVDSGLVAVLAAIAALGVAVSLNATAGYAAPSQVSAAAVITWLVAPWLYGFCCAGGRSLGSLATDTRIIRVSTGEAPEFWRAGWVMFARIVLFPVVILGYVLGALGGGSPSGDGPKERHRTIDGRFPALPAGFPPVPPYDDAVMNLPETERAAAEHSRLPGLYDQGGHRG